MLKGWSSIGSENTAAQEALNPQGKQERHTALISHCAPGDCSPLAHIRELCISTSYQLPTTASCQCRKCITALAKYSGYVRFW